MSLNVSSVLLFKLCKETSLLSRLHCWTLLSDWLTSFFPFNNNIHKMSWKGLWAFVFINNPLLENGKIKLIKSLRNTKRTNIWYKGLKIGQLLYLIAIPKVDSTTNAQYFPTKIHFQALSFWGKFYTSIIFQLPLEFHLLGLQKGDPTLVISWFVWKQKLFY